MIVPLKKLTVSLLSGMMLVICMDVPAYAAPQGLDEVTKQEYYAKYTEIAAEVASETERDISVLPREEWKEENWLPPEEFRSLITAMATWRIDCTEVKVSCASCATKSSTMAVNGRNYTVSIQGDFKTPLNDTTNRVNFGKINSIASAMTGGTWKQTGYEFLIGDAGRTCMVYVSGELTVSGVAFKNVLAYTEFYCGAAGDVR